MVDALNPKALSKAYMMGEIPCLERGWNAMVSLAQRMSVRVESVTSRA